MHIPRDLPETLSAPDRRRPIFDPRWLRSGYPRCLWDGRPKAAGEDFCSERCAEAYAEWEERQTRFDREREVVEEPVDRRTSRTAPPVWVRSRDRRHVITEVVHRTDG